MPHKPTSLYWPLIAVEPVEALFDYLVVRRHVPSVEDGMTFVLLRRSESSEHRILRGFQREEEIVSAVDHQGRRRHPGCEVDLIDFGQLLAGVETSANQHKHLDAFFYGSRCSQSFFPGPSTTR